MPNPSSDRQASGRNAGGPAHPNSPMEPRDSHRQNEVSSSLVSACSFRRPAREIPCRFFLQNRCLKHTACPFSHDPSLRRARGTPDSSDAASAPPLPRSEPDTCVLSEDLPVLTQHEEAENGINLSWQGRGRGLPGKRGRAGGRRLEPGSVRPASSRATEAAAPRSPACSPPTPEPRERDSFELAGVSSAPIHSIDERPVSGHEERRRNQRQRPHRNDFGDPNRVALPAKGPGPLRGGRKSGLPSRRQRGNDSRHGSGSQERSHTPSVYSAQGREEQVSPSRKDSEVSPSAKETEERVSPAGGASKRVARPRGAPRDRPPCVPRRVCPVGPPARADWTWEEERGRLEKLYGSSFCCTFCGRGAKAGAADRVGAGEGEEATPASRGEEGTALVTRDLLGRIPGSGRDAAGEKREDGGAAERPVEETGEKRDSAGTGAARKCFADTESQIVDVVRVTHVPTDPDFDRNILLNGLTVEITVRANYRGCRRHKEKEGGGDERGAGEGRESTTLEQTPSGATTRLPEGATLRVCNEELSDFVRETIPKVFQEYILKNPEEPFVVYGALKFVDRHLATVFALSHTHRCGDSGVAPKKGADGRKAENEPEKKGDWTLEEQKRLEEGLVWYRRVADPVTKWKLIGSFVRTRTAKECAQRFRDCREAILRRAEAAVASNSGGTASPANPSDPATAAAEGTLQEATFAGDEGGESNSSSAVSAPDGDQGAGGKTGENNLQGATISLAGFQLEGASATHPAALKLLVACDRCKKPADIKLATPKDGTVLDISGTAADCGTCHLRMVVRFQPKIAFASSSAIAIVETIQCRMRDLLPSDFIVTCDRCTATMKIREVFSGAPRTAICRHCHNKVLLCYQSPSFSGRAETGAETLTGVTKSLLISTSEKKKKAKDELTLKLGTPLPDNGTCKHYKKSFRWLRFPCCGKAFPCDVCHDDNADHEHAWASRMICGFCSKEQAFSNRPCECGRALTKDGNTAHWEGGKGCRDAVRMNRKDSRKYKLLSRQQAEAGGNKGGRK
uniref:CHY zinc finger protein n=1 Tax=Toxoplasma gondii COUG TaxID=1074873 RepID=A0A2G8XQ25_TOXGO|nr:CHY zinc finger protein [Toxoplasma gondii COUG]